MPNPDFSFTRDARWNELSPTDQQGMLDLAFQDTIAADSRFAELNPDEQQGMRDLFAVEAGARELKLEDTRKFNTFGENFRNITEESFRKVWDAVRLSDDVIAGGDIDADTPDIVAAAIKRGGEQFVPEELQAYHDLFANLSEMGKKDYDNPMDVFTAVAEGVYKLTKEVVTNPKGGALVFAESAGFAAPAIAGSIGGAKLGAAAGTAVAPGAGTAAGAAVGGIIGAFAGGFNAETGARFQEEIIAELQNKGLEPTADNVAEVLLDADFRKSAVSKSIRKGAGTAGVDALLSLGSGKFATAPLRRANKLAVKELGKKATKQQIALRAAEIMGEQTILARLGRKTAVYGLETASEPISEAAGQLAAGDELDYGELAAEAVGGLFGAPITAAAAKTAFGTAEVAKTGGKALSKTGEVIGKVLTPKTEEVKQTRQLTKARSQHGYEANLKKAVESGNVDEFLNPESDTYSPLAAIDALHEINKNPDLSVEDKNINQDKANDLQVALEHAKIKIFETVEDTYNALVEGKEVSKEDRAAFDNANLQINDLNTLSNEVDTLVTAMGKTEDTNAELKSELKKSAKSVEKLRDSIIDIFGSKSAGRDIGSILDIKSLKKNADITKSEGNLVSKLDNLTTNAAKLADAHKDGSGTSKVHLDVMAGGLGFKGVNNYAQAIAGFIKSGNKASAVAELGKLAAFTKRHTNKAKTLRRAYEAANGGQSLNPVEAKALKELNAERVTKGLAPWDFTSKPGAIQKIISNIELEADTLNSAVELGEELVNPTTVEVVKEEPTSDVPPTTAVEDKPTTKEKSEVVEPVELKPEPKPEKPKIQTRADKLVAFVKDKSDEALRVIINNKKAVADIRKAAQKELDSRAKVSEDKDTQVSEAKPEVSAVEETVTPEVTEEVVDPDVGTAHQLTTAEDATNDTNPIRQFFEKHRVKSNMVQYLSNFAQSVRDAIANKTLNQLFTLNQKDELTQQDQDVISGMMRLENSFIPAFKAKFVEFKKDFRKRDPIQDLLVNDEFSDNTLSIFSAAAYQWLADRGQETQFNDMESIARILGYPNDTFVPKHVRQLFERAGSTSVTLAEAIGREALVMLSIKSNGQQEFDYNERLAISIGHRILGTLESQGFIKRTIMDKATLDKISNRETVDYSKLVVEKSTEGKPTVDFYTILTVKVKEDGQDKTILSPNIQKHIRDPFLRSPHTLSRIFTGKDHERSYSWKKIKYPKDFLMKMKRTAQTATLEQTKNLISSMNKPWRASANSMNMFLFLGKDNQQQASGYVDLNKEHQIDRDSAEGINLGIQNNITNLEAWLDDAVLQGGYDTNFYIPAEFWKNGRMGQIGPINPQGSKIHRFLFSMKGWEATIDPTDTEHQAAFFEALGQAFGIETGKVGGIDKARQLTVDLLEEPEMVKAIGAAQKFLELQGDKIDPAAMEELGAKNPEIVADILAGVQKGGENIHSMKGILEYARYLNAKKTGDTFVTDMPTEIDGMSNGPIIGAVQLITNTSPKDRMLSLLKNGGMVFTDKFTDMDTHLDDPKNYDAYEVIGSSWLSRIAKIIEEADAKDIPKMEAVQNLLSQKALTEEDGLITKVMRKLAKQPTMTTVYGVGRNTLINNLIEDTLIGDGFYGELKRIAAENDVEALRNLYQNIKTITGVAPFDGTTAIVNETIVPDVVLNLELNPRAAENLAEFIEENHGKALSAAINDLYEGFQEAREHMNNSVNVTTAIYNSLYIYHIQQKQKEKEVLSEQDFIDVEEMLSDFLPTITTPFGGKLEVAKRSRKRDRKRVARQREDRANVYTRFNNKDKSKKPVYPLNGNPVQRGLLENPGVAAVILNIHNQDSTVANRLIANNDLLNNHDGFAGNMLKGESVATQANQHFYDMVQNYNMVEEFNQSLIASDTAFTEHRKAENINKTELDAIMDAEFKRLGITEFTSPITGKTKIHYKSSWKAIAGNKIKISKVSQETTANKNEVINAVTHMAQYPHRGVGVDIGNAQKATVLGIDPTAITQLEQDRVSEEAKTISANIKGSSDTKIGSNVNSQNISTDPNDYADTHRVNRNNAVEVYDNIKNDSTVKVTPEHDTHLKRILTDIVSKVLNPVDLYLKNDSTIETQGIYDPRHERARIFLSQQQGTNHSGMLGNGLRMSTGEVYSHELVHGITATGLRLKTLASRQLRQQVQRAYDLTRNLLESKPNPWTVFLNDPKMDIHDPANRYEVKAAKERYDYIFNPGSRKSKTYNSYTGETHDRNTSAHLDEFMALGLTNENFNNKLSGLKITKKQEALFSGTMQDILLRIFTKIMNMVQKLYIHEAPATNVAQELERLALTLARIDSQKKGRVMTTVQHLENVTTSLHDKANAKIKQAVNATKVVKAAKILGREMKDHDSVFGQKLRDLADKRKGIEYGIGQAVFDEIKGQDKKYNVLYRLLNARGVLLDQAREEESQNIKTALADLFKRELTVPEKVAITKIVLKTDLDSLRKNYSIKKIAALVKSEAALNKEIAAVTSEIAANANLKPFRHYFKKYSEALGHFMVTGRSAESDTVLSPHVIATMQNTKYKGRLNDASIAEAESLVDRLATLYALKHSTEQNRKTMSDLFAEDAGAIEGVMKVHRDLKDEAMLQLFNNNPVKFIKGYTKQILSPQKQHKTGTLADEQEFAKMGFIRSIEPIRRDPADPDRKRDVYLYTANVGSANSFLSTLFSYTGNRAKGANSYHITEDAADAAINNQMILTKKQKLRDKMFLATPLVLDAGNNNMIAQVDDNGDIVKYRYTMAESTKDSLMEQHNEFDDILGGMGGQIIDKVSTATINEQVVDALKDLYDNEYSKNPRAFVEISPFAKEERLRDIYHMMPEKSKHYMETVWGEQKMFIPKDVIDLTFGYRRYSIVEAFGKTKQERNLAEKAIVGLAHAISGDKGILKAKKFEDLLVEMTKLAKNNIIVRSVHVTLGNWVSNNMYLMSRGVPRRVIFEGTKEATHGAISYQRDMHELGKLKVAQRSGVKTKYTKNQLAAKIRELENEIALNPVTKLIESGLMPSIVDDVETSNTLSPYPGTIEKTVDKYTANLSPKIRKVGKALFMTEDTVGYKTANNAVKMTDFVGRYILYQHYTSAERGDAQMTHNQAVDAVIEEFVNFSVPTHKMVEYGNQIGLFWFSKYKLRILRVIAKSIKEKPTETLTTFMMSSALGASNILESIPGVTSGALNVFGDPLTTLVESVPEILTVNTVDEFTEIIN